MDASGPGASPLERADIVLNFVYLRPLASQNQSASFSLTELFLINASPASSLVLERISASSISEPLASPTANLSFINVVIATFHPSPISPRR